MTDGHTPLKNSLASPEPLPSLEALEQRINKAKGDNAPAAPQREEGMGVAAQAASDLVAGVGVGLVAGYLLDRWLDTSPWLLLLCFCLGTAAGFKLLYQTVKNSDKVVK